MKVTKRQLQRIIKEEKDLLYEQKKFEAMILNEEDSGLLKLAFGALKQQGPKVAEYVKQWLKANPAILEEFLEEMLEDGSIKDMLKSVVPKEDTAPAEA